jgi:hypothetical protein
MKFSLKIIRSLTVEVETLQGMKRKLFLYILYG